MNASDMRELFSSDVSLTMRVPDHGEHTLNGRAEIMEAVTQIKAGVDQLALQFLDPKVTLEPDKQKAIVSTTLHVLIGLNPQQQEYFLEMKLAWNQTKDGWVVSRLETIKTFGR